jgi:hypothetical protein
VQEVTLLDCAPKLDQMSCNFNIFQVENILGRDLAIQVLLIPAAAAEASRSVTAFRNSTPRRMTVAVCTRFELVLEELSRWHGSF